MNARGIPPTSDLSPDGVGGGTHPVLDGDTPSSPNGGGYPSSPGWGTTSSLGGGYPHPVLDEGCPRVPPVLILDGGTSSSAGWGTL